MASHISIRGRRAAPKPPPMPKCVFCGSGWPDYSACPGRDSVPGAKCVMEPPMSAEQIAVWNAQRKRWKNTAFAA